jgi:hypothetical protein
VEFAFQGQRADLVPCGGGVGHERLLISNLRLDPDVLGVAP